MAYIGAQIRQGIASVQGIHIGLNVTFITNAPARTMVTTIKKSRRVLIFFISVIVFNFFLY